MKYSSLQTLTPPLRRTVPLFCTLFLFVMTITGSGFASTLDLNVDGEPLPLAVGSSGTQIITVTNTGDPATASVILTYYTPTFCNLTTTQPTLPPGVTSSVLYTNTNRFIPSVIQYTITAAALNASGSINVPVGLTVPSGTPQTPSMVTAASVTVYPIAGGGDTEANEQDNINSPAVPIEGASPGTVSSSSPALFLVPSTGTAYSDNSTTSTTGSVIFIVGDDKNAGPTTQPFGLVFFLPPYIRYTASDSLTSCSVLFPSSSNTDLTLEQIVSCTNSTLLPANSSCLLSLLGICIIPNLSPPTATVTIKVTGHPGAIVGLQQADSAVFTTGSDVDQELYTNVSSISLVVPH